MKLIVSEKDYGCILESLQENLKHQKELIHGATNIFARKIIESRIIQIEKTIIEVERQECND